MQSPRTKSISAFTLIELLVTITCVLGLLHGPDYSAWESMADTLGIVDSPSFVRVAYIHNASYLGGLIGLIAAIIYLSRQNRHRPTAVQFA